jgi:hypothetical protein
MAFDINAVVAQAIEALQQSKRRTMSAPADMLDKQPDLLVTAEILGQEPRLRRRLGTAGTAFIGAWAQAAAAAGRITILRGNGQVALIGTTVRIVPAITVTDGFGRPIPGVAVAIAVTAGGGKVVPGTLNTGQDGVASATAWTLGTTPGLNQLQFTVPGGPTADFRAFAVATRRCDVVDGDGQKAAAGSALKTKPVVKIVDVATGQPLAGINVAFHVRAGGGSIVNATAATDQDGNATPGVWTLGAAKGSNTLEATVVGAGTTTFTAQAT